MTAMTAPRTGPARKLTGALPALIVREWAPQNLEMPFGAIDGFVTPVEQFYVRSHFGVPTSSDTATAIRKIFDTGYLPGPGLCDKMGAWGKFQIGQ